MNIVERITRAAAEVGCSEPGCTAEILCERHGTYAICAALAAEQDWVWTRILAPNGKQWLDIGFEVPRAEAAEWVAEYPQWRRIKP